MDYRYFHIPTKIVHGYESFMFLIESEELRNKRVMLVVDISLTGVGNTQKLRRFIENLSYGLIFYEVLSQYNVGVSQEAINLVRDSKIQTIVAFGNPYTLAYARAMSQFGGSSLEYEISYIEIPSIPCVYPGILDTYYIPEENETLKKSNTDLNSRAKLLILDPSFVEFSKISDILLSSVGALAYSFDALISRYNNVLSECHALKAIELIILLGNRLPNEPTNIKIKHELMLATLLASLSIQTAGLGITAALAMSMENVSICSEYQAAGAVLMSVLDYSLVSNTMQFQKLYRSLGFGGDEDPLQSSVKILKTVKSLLEQMEIKSLSHYTLTKNSIDLIARQASQYRCVLDLAKPAGFYELTDILNSAIHNDSTEKSQDVVEDIDIAGIVEEVDPDLESIEEESEITTESETDVSDS